MSNVNRSISLTSMLPNPIADRRHAAFSSWWEGLQLQTCYLIRTPCRLCTSRSGRGLAQSLELLLLRPLLPRGRVRASQSSGEGAVQLSQPGYAAPAPDVSGSRLVCSKSSGHRHRSPASPGCAGGGDVCRGAPCAPTHRQGTQVTQSAVESQYEMR